MGFQPYDGLIVPPSPHKGIILPRLYGTAQHHRHSSQGAGSQTHYYARARLHDGFIKWVGIFHDPDAYDVFLLALMRHQIDGDPIPRDIAALCDMPWYPGLDELPLVYEFATVVSFTSVGTTSWTPPTLVTQVDYLLVAGGAGGAGGGGGAGGVRTATKLPVVGSQTVVIGGGGFANNRLGVAGNGSPSTFGSLTSTGGGAGGSGSVPGIAGGSGGGGYDGTGGGPASPAGQGNQGGIGTEPGGAYSVGGGGGGWKNPGVNAGTSPGAGGDGNSSSISGAPVNYAGGGGGAPDARGGAGSAAGGLGGGGAGGLGGGAGAANLGGGGGGGGWTGSTSTLGGVGGSGVLFLSFTPISLVWFRQRHYLRR
jgi:hypothetical protein